MNMQTELQQTQADLSYQLSRISELQAEIEAAEQQVFLCLQKEKRLRHCAPISSNQSCFQPSHHREG